MSASTVLAVTVYANPSLCPSECTQLVSVLLLKVLKWDLACTLVSKVRSKEKEKLLLPDHAFTPPLLSQSI